MGLFNFIKSKMSDDVKLLMAVNGGILELESNYRKLSNEGRFEVLFFNCSYVLNLYEQEYPTKHKQTQNSIYKTIFDNQRKHEIYFSVSEYVNFVNKRSNFYLEELDQLFNCEGYIPYKLYSKFYLAPFSDETIEDIEALPFNIQLMLMMKWISEAKNLYFKRS